MKALSEAEILKIWEIGMTQHPVDRALTILRLVFPDHSHRELASLSIGQRDRYLLSVHEQTFGDHLDGYTDCPQCSERLEFTCSTQDLQLSPNLQEISPNLQENTLTILLGSLEMHYRLPNSQDLAMLVSSNSLETAYELLVDQCLLKAKRADVEITTDELTIEEKDHLAEAIAQADPQAEILLDFSCPACRNSWQELFDIVSFLWAEISSQAQRLLREVHLLALAYGWSEREILALSPTRRRVYLELAS